MTKYNIDEIFQFAIRIEENGEAFYRDMAKRFESDHEAAELFLQLAEQEIEHKNFFSSLLKSIADYSSDSYNEEYFLYLRAFADNSIFAGAELKKQLEAINDAKGAIKFAMNRELESVLYYQELKLLVKTEKQGTLDRIIDEEKKHFLKLHDMFKNS